MSAAIHLTGSAKYCPAIVEGERISALLGLATCEHCITDAAQNIARGAGITFDAALERVAVHQARYRMYAPKKKASA